MIDRSLNYGRPLIKDFLSDVAPYHSIADIGAGTGVDLKIARDVCSNADIHAIEVHKPYVQNLRLLGWSVHSIDIERDPFPFSAESMDVLMANQILEHVKEIYWIFHQISRSLRVGGHMVLGVPNLASLHNRLLLAFGKQPTSIHLNSAHIRGFTKPGLMRFLDDVAPGLYRLRRFGGANFYPFPRLLAVPLARMFPTMAWGAFFLLEKQRTYTSDFLDYAAPGKLETNFYVG